MELELSFGLKNNAGSFLTAEPFGFRMNWSSKVMKKKQIFSLVNIGGKKYLRSHMNRFLSFKEDGKLQGDAESAGAEEAVEMISLGENKWALQTSLRGYYVGGREEAVDAFARKLADDRIFTIQLAIHPQVSVKSFGRQRYMRLSKEKNQLLIDADQPWGQDCLITLGSTEDCRLTFEVSDGRFVSSSGELKAAASEDCKFTLEFKSDNLNQVAFKANNGKFINAMGVSGIVCASKDMIGRDGPGKDEWFILEDSQPQFKLKSIKSQKFASNKGGKDICCNAVKFEGDETFQFEINPHTKQWSIYCFGQKFWSVQVDGGITAATSRENRGKNEWFTASWNGPRLILQASNGKYVAVKANGACSASAVEITDEVGFQFELINRPQLVLRGENGFVSSGSSGEITSVHARGEVFKLTVAAGILHISSTISGKYWEVNKTDKPGQVTVSGVAAGGAGFTAEFVEHSKMLLKSVATGKYVQGQSNGIFAATGTSADSSTLWEY